MMVFMMCSELTEVAEPLPSNVIPIRPVEEVIAEDVDFNERIDALKQESEETDAIFSKVMGEEALAESKKVAAAKAKRRRKVPAIKTERNDG